jgi:serine phosphatase RsbU (regulator of sigma subunit)
MSFPIQYSSKCRPYLSGQMDLTLEPEDPLRIFTDGITEAMQPSIDGLELFGTERFDRALSECGSDRTCDCTGPARKAIATFTNDAAPTEDQTMLITGQDPGSSGSQKR